MIKPEQIPDEVLRAFVDAEVEGKSWREGIAAALNAWPGGIIGTAAVASSEAGEPTYRDKAFLLPLPPEKGNR
jgi:hypothetical protein